MIKLLISPRLSEPEEQSLLCIHPYAIVQTGWWAVQSSDQLFLCHEESHRGLPSFFQTELARLHGRHHHHGLYMLDTQSIM